MGYAPLGTSEREAYAGWGASGETMYVRSASSTALTSEGLSQCDAAFALSVGAGMGEVVVERTAKGVWKERADGRAVRARVRNIIVLCCGGRESARGLL